MSTSFLPVCPELNCSCRASPWNGTLHIAFGLPRAQPPPRHCPSKTSDRAQKAQTRTLQGMHRGESVLKILLLLGTISTIPSFQNSAWTFPPEGVFFYFFKERNICIRQEPFEALSISAAVVVPSPDVTGAENSGKKQEIWAAQPQVERSWHCPGATAPQGGQGPHPSLHCCILITRLMPSQHCCILITRFLQTQVELNPHRAELCYLQITSLSNKLG